MAIYINTQNTPAEMKQALEKITAQKIQQEPVSAERIKEPDVSENEKTIAALQQEIVRLKRGQVETETKRKVSIWLDKAVIERAREGGPGWQGRLNEFLIRHFK